MLIIHVNSSVIGSSEASSLVIKGDSRCHESLWPALKDHDGDRNQPVFPTRESAIDIPSRVRD
jgi:hypothetical protein